jgi:hypothetical protein
MTDPMTIAEILDAAADLITPPGKWTQIQMAADLRGECCDSTSPEARCWCAAGAIVRVGGYSDYEGLVALSAAYDAADCAVGGSLTEFNDDPHRTQAEVVAALRKAAAIAREAGQ